MQQGSASCLHWTQWALPFRKLYRHFHKHALYWLHFNFYILKYRVILIHWGNFVPNPITNRNPELGVPILIFHWSKSLGQYYHLLLLKLIILFCRFCWQTRCNGIDSWGLFSSHMKLWIVFRYCTAITDCNRWLSGWQ